MRRIEASLEEIADLANVASAFRLAARGKRGRPDVERFRAEFDIEIAGVRAAILAGVPSLGRARRFVVHDPKRRSIEAPCFRDRVLHHALMAPIAPVLDAISIDDSYACRPGKGALEAVRRAQDLHRRQAWRAQIDIDGYFASIEHDRLLALLGSRFADKRVLALLEAIVRRHEDGPGRGLPIGALTSQHLANFYLNSLDRLLLERCRLGGVVRYMDDILWWAADRERASAALARASEHARDALGLTIKEGAEIKPTAAGFSFCGYRVTRARLALSKRRKRRYAELRRRWENRYAHGEIDGPALQAAYASVFAITAHADAAGWRRAELARRPLAPALEAL